MLLSLEYLNYTAICLKVSINNEGFTVCHKKEPPPRAKLPATAIYMPSFDITDVAAPDERTTDKKAPIVPYFRCQPMPCTQAYIISLNHLKYEITNLFDETSYSINSTTNFSYGLPYGLPKYKKGSNKTLEPLISLVRCSSYCSSK